MKAQAHVIEQRSTSGQRVWVAGVGAWSEGEGGQAGWRGQGVAEELSRGESDPAR